MIWHDCKTDPPKKNGKYIIANTLKKSWHEAIYENNKWYVKKWLIDKPKFCKWAEVDLSEAE